MKNVAVVFGGNSSEYEISLQSGANVCNTIDATKFNIYPVLMKGTDWKLSMPGMPEIQLNKADFSLNTANGVVKFDCVVIAIHGNPGEDGVLQAYFELIGMPYTSCGFMSASLTFNKYYCNNYLRTFGITMAKSVIVRKGVAYDAKQIVNELRLPIFVKPSAGGSSCGVSKVKTETDVVPAIEKALKESDEVIIEEFIAGTEVTCGVVKTSKRSVVFPITEIVSKNEFFDYEAKYTSKMSDEITPARINEELTARCQQISSQVYDLLNCRGIVRIDYILHNNEFYFLEINTVPGATAMSIIPQQARVAGVSLTEVYTEMIEDAIAAKQ